MAIEQDIVEAFQGEGFTATMDGKPITTDSVVRYSSIIAIKAEEGYKINRAQVLLKNGRTLRFSIDWTFKKATLRNFGDYFKYFFADGITIDVEALPKPKITQEIYDSVIGENYDVLVDGEPISVGLEITPETVIELKAHKGYGFEKAHVLDATGRTHKFEISDGLDIATLEGINGFLKHLFDKSFHITVVEMTPDVLNVNDVYLIDPDSARKVTKEAFVNTYGEVKTDYSPFLLGLIELPFNIDSDYILGEQNVKLSDYDTKIPAILLDRDKIEYDMGVISVPSVKGNSTDYMGVNVVLHLPYSNSVVLETDYVVGAEIGVSYIISMYDGSAIINVTSSKTGDVIHTENVDMNVSIPFGRKDTAPIHNNPSDIQLGGFNGIYKPFIEIMRTNYEGVDDFFNIPIKDEGVLKEETGYLEVNYVELKSKAKGGEKETIVDMLRNGVIIK